TFRVGLVAPGKHAGPSSVNQGEGKAPQFGAAWGGGPSGVQNLSIHPAPPQLRIVLLFVDTKDQEFDPAAMPDIKTRWQENVIDGVSSDPNHPSVKKFYADASGGSLDVSVDMFGPFHLGQFWSAVGPVTNQMPSSASPDNVFIHHVQAAITAADDAVD